MNCSLTCSSMPFEFFSLIFTPELMENIRKWTDKRAKEKINNTIRRKQKKCLWRELTLTEMKTFVGSLLTMGIVKLPNLRMYWNTQTRLFANSGIHDIITFQRFQDIYSCLCLRDPAFDSDDKLCKIEPLQMSIIFNSQFYYRPKQFLSLDESMIPFLGRSSLKVFMPLKPVKYGLKAYVLCESTTGFVVNWCLHTGRKKNKENSAIYNIVMRLVDGCEGEDYTLFMDRYYSTLRLFIDLKDIQIRACGTIQSKRLHLDDKTSKEIDKIKDNEIKYFSGPSKLLLSVFKDHKTVLVLSNYHQPENLDKERRIRKKNYNENTKPNAKEIVKMPRSIIDYNLYMRGVDNFDQLISYYCPNIRSKRWYVKVFFHFLEIAIVNSYTIYKSICESQSAKIMSHLEFRKEIIRELVSDVRQDKEIPSTPKKINRFRSGSLCEGTEEVKENTVTEERKTTKKNVDKSTAKKKTPEKGNSKADEPTLKKTKTTSSNYEKSKAKITINLSTTKKTLVFGNNTMSKF